MTWTKIDDAFLEDETILALRHTTYRLHVSALVYCSRNLTDGVVTDRAVKVLQAILGFSVKRLVTELVDAGLWIPMVGGGYEIKNFLKYNPSAEQVKEERRKARARMTKKREGSGEQPGEGSGELAGEGSPSPARPVPSQGVGDLSALPSFDEAGHGELLWRRLCVAAGARTPQDIGKLERTVRARKSTEREIVCAIEAATGPGVRDPLAVALAELVKRHGERNAA